MTKIEPTEKPDWEKMRDGEIDAKGNTIDGTNPSVARKRTEITDVRLVHIELPFWNMVMFMVTAAIAAIPAFIILSVIGFAVMTFFGVVIPGMSGGIK